MYLRFHLKCSLILPDFNKIWIFHTDFHDRSQYQISWKSVQWKLHGYTQADNQRHADGRKDMKLTGAFCDYAHVPKESKNLKFHLLFGSVNISGARGGVVVEALCYKPEGRGFDFRWCHWIVSLIESFRSHYGPGAHSASNRVSTRNILGVKAACA
jgi:hypothetical protein